ncbi:MAG: hypothetical protein AAFO95_04525 [Cyanobacteria bacterium J06600_6]
MPTKILAETPLPSANPTLLSHNSDSQLSEVQAYAISKYNYCDASLLADLWGQPIYQAKARIGRKVIWQAGGIPYLEQMLVDARVTAIASGTSRCQYIDMGYTYDDAVVLAEFWGDSDPWEAKVRIKNNLILGNQDAVDSALRQAKNQ